MSSGKGDNDHEQAEGPKAESANAMNPIAAAKLRNQGITRPRPGAASGIVAWLGAVQAQEYPGAKWALGLRMRQRITDAALDRAVDAGRILRTHVLRPTWHFVTPSDIRWMLELTAPHVHRVMAPYNRHLELDAAIMSRALAVFERALEGGCYLTRLELAERLAAAGIEAKGSRLAHVVMHAELERVICSGPRRGARFTYALLDERAPALPGFTRDEALGELARRYLRSHGPATIRDFVWWSGLRTLDAKRAFEITRGRPLSVDGRTYWTIGGTTDAAAPRRPDVHLLPIYDEYVNAYRDRDLAPHSSGRLRSSSGASVTFQHALVIDGSVAGTWRVVRQAKGVRVDVFALRPLKDLERRGIVKAADRYQRFLEDDVAVRFP